MPIPTADPARERRASVTRMLFVKISLAKRGLLRRRHARAAAVAAAGVTGRYGAGTTPVAAAGSWYGPDAGERGRAEEEDDRDRAGPRRALAHRRQ